MPRRWPGSSATTGGNIRELENLIHREFLLAEGEQISIPAPSAALAAGPALAEATINYRHAKNQAITEFESRFLTRLIEQANGNVSAAARISGTERRHLGRLLRKYHIPRHPSPL